MDVLEVMYYGGRDVWCSGRVKMKYYRIYNKYSSHMESRNVLWKRGIRYQGMYRIEGGIAFVIVSHIYIYCMHFLCTSLYRIANNDVSYAH